MDHGISLGKYDVSVGVVFPGNGHGNTQGRFCQVAPHIIVGSGRLEKKPFIAIVDGICQIGIGGVQNNVTVVIDHDDPAVGKFRCHAQMHGQVLDVSAAVGAQAEVRTDQCGTGADQIFFCLVFYLGVDIIIAFILDKSKRTDDQKQIKECQFFSQGSFKGKFF